MYNIIRSFFHDQEKQIKTKLVRICLLVFLCLCFLIVFWGSFIEPKIITVINVPINLDQTSKKENLKIALIADLHVGAYKKNFFVQRVVNKTIAENPDLVLLDGDYILGKGENARFLAPLKELAAKYPTFAVTGNHEFNLAKENRSKFQDRTATLRVLFEEWGIKILDNESKTLHLQNSIINLVGLPDIWTGKADLITAARNIDPRQPTILLCHNPDIILDKNAENFDLVLSGHTHAGQIRLPWIGAVPSLPTELGKKFTQGLFKLKNGYLYITAGLGETGPRARLMSPPELSIINLDL